MRHQLSVAGNVVNHLGKQTTPVDGVRAGKGNLATLHDLFGESIVPENVLGAGLAIVEIALNGPDHNTGACLGCHLLVLDIAYAAIGVHYRDLDAVFIAESFQGCLAGIARCCNQNEEGVLQLSLLT